MKGFIRNQMDGMAEESYAVFQKKLVFTSLPVEGIRIPRLRALVSAAGEYERRAFMDGCEFSSFEEVLVYGFCAGKIREKEKLKKEIDFLLPHFDNWAHVDCVTASLSAIKRDRDFFLGAYSGLAGAEGEFYKRFLAVMLMDFYLDEKYVSVVADIYAGIKQGQYYTDMAIAWGLSVMLVKFPEIAFPLLERGVFSDFVTLKAIQKAIESRRISEDMKLRLRAVKNGVKALK